MNQKLPIRNRKRRSDHDYSTPGAYFVTISCHQHMEFMAFEECERIARDVWECLPKFHNVKLDEIAIIPNYVHFIIWICEKEELGGDNETSARIDSTQSRFHGRRLPTLPTVIQTFKAEISRRIRSQLFKDFKWDISYFDFVIRNETELATLRYYIKNNPTALNIKN